MDTPEEALSPFLSFPGSAISFAKLLVSGLIMVPSSSEKDDLHIFSESYYIALRLEHAIIVSQTFMLCVSRGVISRT